MRKCRKFCISYFNSNISILSCGNSLIRYIYNRITLRCFFLDDIVCSFVKTFYYYRSVCSYYICYFCISSIICSCQSVNTCFYLNKLKFFSIKSNTKLCTFQNIIAFINLVDCDRSCLTFYFRWIRCFICCSFVGIFSCLCYCCCHFYCYSFSSMCILSSNIISCKIYCYSFC